MNLVNVLMCRVSIFFEKLLVDLSGTCFARHMFALVHHSVQIIAIAIARSSCSSWGFSATKNLVSCAFERQCIGLKFLPLKLKLLDFLSDYVT